MPSGHMREGSTALSNVERQACPCEVGRALPRPAADISTVARHQTPAGTDAAEPAESLERRSDRDDRGPGRMRRLVRRPS